MTGRTQDDGEPVGVAEVDPFQPAVGLLGILRILFKWSFVVAPLAALTIWLALSQTDSIDPEYTAELSTILIGPSELLIEDPLSGEITVEGVNPLQQLGGTLSTVARVTVLALSDPSVSAQLRSEGLTDNFEIGTENSRSPILLARATDVDPEIAAATIDRISELIVQDLATRQDELEAPEANRIGTQLISKGLRGGPDFGARNRMRLAVGAVGLGVSAASAFLLEGAWQLWRRRKQRKAAVEANSRERGLPSGDRYQDRIETSLVASFEDLYASEADRLVDTLHFITGDERLAENVAAETFDRASAIWPPPTRAHPIVWLYGEAVGRAWVNPSNVAPDEPLSADPLWGSVLDLPTETRATLALSHIAELPNERIASALNIDVSAVEGHRARAAHRLGNNRVEASAATESPADPTRSSSADSTNTSDVDQAAPTDHAVAEGAGVSASPASASTPIATNHDPVRLPAADTVDATDLASDDATPSVNLQADVLAKEIDSANGLTGISTKAKRRAKKAQKSVAVVAPSSSLPVADTPQAPEADD